MQAAAPKACVASAPLGTFELTVQPASGQPLPVRQINILDKGQTLAYKPVNLPPDSEKAKLSLVLAPADQTQDSQVLVLDPQDARKPATWTTPFRVSVVGVVFGPQGLDKKKVTKLVRKDQELITQLAGYAEQTQQVESLVQALSDAEQSPTPSKSVQAALSGFAAQNGAGAVRLDRTQPANQQASLLLQTLNPALGAYDPLAAQSATRMQQSAGIAASVAGLFFGSTVGLAGGGAAMALNLRTLLSPDTEFRSALGQPQADNSLTLCAKRQPAKARTRLAYLWAARVPNAAAPILPLAAAAHLPAGLKSEVPLAKGTETKLVERARDWALVSADGKSFPVPVKAAPGALDVDLTKAAVPPGAYKLAAKWDWAAFQAQGEVNVHAPVDLKTAVPAPQSADKLIAGAGEVPLTLHGPDFEFVEGVTLAGIKKPVPLEFKLPLGKRAGPQDKIEVALDTSSLKAGRYKLAFAQSGGSSTEVPVRVLPPNPALQNLPVRVNLGLEEQKVVLKGSGLDRIEALDSDKAKVDLAPAQPGQTSRDAVVHPGEGLKKGDKIDLQMKVEGVEGPLPVPGAIEVAGPLPKIVVAKATYPDDLGVAVRDGELPAGSFVSVSMQVDNVEGQPAVTVRCADDAKALQPATLRPGTKQTAARLDMAGQNLLFLSFEPGAFGQTGCPMTATVQTEAAGISEPYKLGAIVRLPRIESFTLTDEKAGDNAYYGTLIGQDLETIEKTGWTASAGMPVDGLPKPVAGATGKQSLRVVVSWPSPAPRAPLYIWLRGEAEGRLTKARY